MNAYSEDLRKKIVEAVQRGMSKTEATRSFGVSRLSVKRYATMARAGKPLSPKKRPGSKPKLDEGAKRLLESDLEQLPTATLPERREYLKQVAGARLSESTVSRMLKRMGWRGKKIGGCDRTPRVPEGRRGEHCWPQRRKRVASCSRGRDGRQRLALATLYASARARGNEHAARHRASAPCN